MNHIGHLDHRDFENIDGYIRLLAKMDCFRPEGPPVPVHLRLAAAVLCGDTATAYALADIVIEGAMGDRLEPTMDAGISAATNWRMTWPTPSP